MKKIFSLLIFSITTFSGFSQTIENQKKTNEQAFLEFIQSNPDKASLQIIRNDTVAVSYHAERKMPLASTVKIIIAIEYAKQVAAKLQNENELIKETELNKYYIPNTDGGAHPAWKNFLSKKNIDISNGFPLKEIVKGMIIFSSNANAEFLMDKLGLNNINKTYETLIQQHDPIYPIVSALFVANQIKLSGDSLLNKLRSLDNNIYIKYCNQIHQQLKSDTTGNFKKSLPFLSFEIQKIWSDRLPGSNAKEYAALMQKIVNRKYFTDKVQIVLDEILQWPMELNPANKTVYKQLGMKGGSTAFVLTLAGFAEDLHNNKTTLCVMFNNLTIAEGSFLQQRLNSFIATAFSNEIFIAQLKKELH